MENQDKDIADCIERSRLWLQNNPVSQQAVREWIGRGTTLNWAIHNGQSNPHLGLATRLSDLLQTADIRLKEERWFYRETSFAKTYQPTLTSVTLYPHFTGTYGDIHYRIRVPAGTRVFFVSALDLLPPFPLPLEETEQEFLLELGTYCLDGDTLIYYPFYF